MGGPQNDVPALVNGPAEPAPAQWIVFDPDRKRVSFYHAGHYAAAASRSLGRIFSRPSALIGIDMQNDNELPRAPLFKQEARDCIAPILRALAFARDNGVRVIYIAQAHRSDGSDLGQFGELYPAAREGRALIEGTPSPHFSNPSKYR